MSRSLCVVARWPSKLVLAALFALVLTVVNAPVAWSQVLPVVLQVEEDWELVVAEADADNTAPQVTCTISPNSHLKGLHSTIELNHQTVPEFSSGGVHLQTWHNEYNLYRRSIESDATLATSGETVTWTMKMKLVNNTLWFAVLSGNSSTWGAFGGGTALHSWYGTSLVNLNGYTPDVSVANSGVGFASNRVHTLTLKQVRYTLADGTVITDDQPRIVHQLSE